MKYTAEMHEDEKDLSTLQLDDLYNPEGDGEHPVFSRSQWKRDVASDNTVSGYWDWVFNQIQNWEPEEQA